MRIQLHAERHLGATNKLLDLRDEVLEYWPDLVERVAAQEVLFGGIADVRINVLIHETYDAELVRWMALYFDDLVYGKPQYVDDEALDFLIEYIEEKRKNPEVKGLYSAILDTIEYQGGYTFEGGEQELYLTLYKE